MLSPLSLRLCCTAAMAPALTSEAATRARDKLPGTTSLACISPAGVLMGKNINMNLTGNGNHAFTADPRKSTQPHASAARYITTSVVDKSILANKSVSSKSVRKQLNVRRLVNSNLVTPPQTMCIAPDAEFAGGSAAPLSTPVSPPVSTVDGSLRSAALLTTNSVREKSSEQHRHSFRLLQRIRRLQSRQSISHTKQQLTGFVTQQNRNLEPIDTGNGGDLKPDVLKTKDVKNLSTAALVNLVHKLQSSQPAALRQHLSGRHNSEPEPTKLLPLDEDGCAEFDRVSGHLSHNLKHLEKVVDSDATESSSGGESCDEMDYDFENDCKETRPSLTQRAEWRWALERASVASRWTWLQAQVSDLEYRIRQQNDIYRQIRASKGAVVLGDQQIHEDKLRLQSRSAKRVNILEIKGNAVDSGKTEMSPSDMSTLLSNVARQSSQVAQQLGNVLTPLSSPAVPESSGLTCAAANIAASSAKDGSCVRGTVSMPNGYMESRNAHTPEARLNDGCSSPPPDPTCQASRCRPVRSYRKRKLLKTSGLHQVSRKAARLSTVKCHCFPPAVPCALCGGRHNNIMQLDPEVMPLQERVALLDPSFHPVLSFNQDIPLSVHFESLLKSGRWQHKPPPKSVKALKADKKRARTTKENVKKYTKRTNKGNSAIVLSSTKIKNKYETHKGIRRDGLLATPKKADGARTRLCRTEGKIRKRRQLNKEFSRDRNATLKKMHMRIHNSTSAHSASYMRGTPSPTTFREAVLRRKRGENAFDINNIVIPYNIASSTRVEKLQYKEILTPSWRTLNNEKSTDKNPEVEAEDIEGELAKGVDNKPMAPIGQNGIVTLQLPEEDESEEEDISDESYLTRHLRSEEREKKRFAAYHEVNKRARGSRSDSGAHTPDPISPGTALTDPHVGISSVNHTPTPSTPSAVTADNEYFPSAVTNSIAASDCLQRQRLDSVSRSRSCSQSEERGRCMLPQLRHGSNLSWVKRQFPLEGHEVSALYKDCSQHVAGHVRSCVTFPLTNGRPHSTNHPASPLSGSSTSSVIDEDPDDPEWTIVGDRPVIVPKATCGLVLKLAKR